nr:MAG TPA: hypothetical protein [Caudoviricetes sp.]
MKLRTPSGYTQGRGQDQRRRQRRLSACPA